MINGSQHRMARMTNTGPDLQPARRDFIVRAAQGFAAVGGIAALWPFLAQMAPNPGTAPPETRDVDLTRIAPGQTVTVPWKTQPISIRHRTSAEIARARAVRVSDLPDPAARSAQLPPNALASDENRTQAGYESWLVVVSLCTHMGCRLNATTASEAAASGEGWVCPCHAARFDLSGRVVGGPARTNLPVPPYRFLAPTRIRIG
jgi:ubiquinol-cytochrome c reductase iron-sulfur subunit